MKNTATAFAPFKFIRSALACSILLPLLGCGGGSSSAPSFSISALQGRWATETSANPGYTAIVMANAPANMSAAAWVLAQDGSSLEALTIESDGKTNGRYYSFKGLMPSVIAGITKQELSVTPLKLTLPGPTAAPLELKAVDALTGASRYADAAGAWQGALDVGQKTVSWSIGASGAIAGASSTGCVYSGSLSALSHVKAFYAVFSESCSDGTANGFTGVATVSSDSTRLTVAAEANDKSKAMVLLLGK